MQLRKAERRKLKARIGMSGASGSGKTYSSLRIAYGFVGDWSKIAIIDTENGRGELYVNTNRNNVAIGEYNVLTLDPPFTPRRYIEAIKTCEEGGMEAIIIDSLSHAWAGVGGMLEMKERFSATEKSDFTAWRKITPEHNLLVDALLRTKCHLIVTLRAKAEYALTERNGKMVPQKVGMAPIFRDGLEYEMVIFMELSQDHFARASKDNTGIFDQIPFTPTEESGTAIRAWLESGVDAPPPAKEETPAPTQILPPATEKPKDGKANWTTFWPEVKKLSFDKEQVHKLAGTDSIADWTQTQIDQLLKKLKEQKGVA